MKKLNDIRYDIDTLLLRSKFPKDNGIIGKALAIYELKNIPASHVLAEVLVAHYIKSKGFTDVDIEHTVAGTKCDVYARARRIDICIEIEFPFVPPKHIIDSYEYLLAKHVKKIAQIARSGIMYASFAYPRGVIPLVPIDFLRPPASRIRKRLLELISITRKFFPIDEAEEEALWYANIYGILIFDLSSARIYELTTQTVEILITLYDSFLTE